MLTSIWLPLCSKLYAGIIHQGLLKVKAAEESLSTEHSNELPGL